MLYLVSDVADHHLQVHWICSRLVVNQVTERRGVEEEGGWEGWGEEGGREGRREGGREGERDEECKQGWRKEGGGRVYTGAWE